MRQAKVYVHGVEAAVFTEEDHKYRLKYLSAYQGAPISLSLPLDQQEYLFEEFPAFFEGLLPEGFQLEALLKQKKIDRKDYLSQLLAVGEDLVGAVTLVEETP